MAQRFSAAVRLLVGIKLPTGADNVLDTRERLGDDGEPVLSVETVDQSVQPGGEGFGFIVDMSAYRQLGAGGALAAYASGGLPHQSGRHERGTHLS